MKNKIKLRKNKFNKKIKNDEITFWGNFKQFILRVTSVIYMKYYITLLL